MTTREPHTGGAQSADLDLAHLAKLGTVDERYQGYNVEMVEVTGGRFWAPYGGPPGEVYRHRSPVDLTDPRLIALARQLGPSLMRVSGTWANNTYLLAEGETLTAPPEGYKQVLTRDQWRSVVAFSKAVDAPIVTSFAVSGGTRDADGGWTTDQAQRLVDLTHEAGGKLYAAEFFNEPTAPGLALGMPAGYSAETYAAEFRIFRDWARKAAPDMMLVGPGGFGEGSMAKVVEKFGDSHVSSEDMLKGNRGSLDAVSYHFYGSVSQRAERLKIGTAVKAEALSAKWLDRTVIDADYYGGLRDVYEPGKPLWNTETAQAAAGGSEWASTFVDSFRYLNQLGALAQRDVQVVMHNTLAASDYGLIDWNTLAPRPNYWAAVLWRRIMGSTVLASPMSPSPDVRVYAHSLRDAPGGVGLVVLNTGAAPQQIAVGSKAMGWTMSGEPLDTRTVTINGRTPEIDARGDISGLDGASITGPLQLPGQSITFIAVPEADNPACR